MRSWWKGSDRMSNWRINGRNNWMNLRWKSGAEGTEEEVKEDHRIVVVMKVELVRTIGFETS